jgi:signal transduction histidine kinase
MSEVDFVEVDELPTSPELLHSVTLQKVVQAALRSLKPKMDEAGIQVAEKGLQSIPVTTDALQLQTAIEEILKNGIEAMMFSNEKWLTITGSVDRGVAHLSIEDTGVGISPENLKKVFDPFFSTKDSQGVARGLGLNVARRVIEELKGKVSIESHQAEKHSGTTVRMEWSVPETVPAAPPEVPAAQVITKQPAAGATANSSPTGLSDLDLLADVYEEENMKFEPFPKTTRKFPEVAVRKPVVRSLD